MITHLSLTVRTFYTTQRELTLATIHHLHPGRSRLHGSVWGSLHHHTHATGPRYTTEGAKWSSSPFELSVEHHHILRPYLAATLHQPYQIKTLLPPHPLGNPPNRSREKKWESIQKYCQLVSLPITIKVMNATMRPVVAVRIPEVDDMVERAQEKVDAIKRAKEWTEGLRPIDEVIFA